MKTKTNKNNQIMEPLSKFLGVTKFPLKLFNEQGYLIYREDSDGFWIKREYDEQGNPIYYEDSNGFWSKREYDEQGNRIYRETSNGLWSKKEYDEQGNLIYCETSIIGVEFDKRQYSRSVDVTGIGKVSMETIQEALKEKFGKNENKNK